MMAGLNQCHDQLVEQFLTRLNKFEFILVINNCLEVNNHQLIKRLIQQTSANVPLKELLYEFIFDISQRKVTDKHEAYNLMIKQQQIAITYAITNKGEPWETCLKNMFGDNLAAVREEYKELMQYNKGKLYVETVTEDMVRSQFNVLKVEQVA